MSKATENKFVAAELVDKLIDSDQIDPNNRATAIAIVEEFNESITEVEAYGHKIADVRHTALKMLNLDSSVDDAWLRQEVGISDDDAEAVLEYMAENYNAEIGINWDVIQATIEILVDDRKITLIKP